MNFAQVAAASVALLLASSQLAKADLAKELVGVWKGKAHTQKPLDGSEASTPLGASPTGTAIFTSGGNFTWIFLGDGRKASGFAPPDTERVALYNSLAFGTGTYRVEGDKVTLRYDGSWNQIWTGTERSQTLKIDGKTLMWTSPSFKRGDGKEVVATFTYERVE